MDPIPLTRKRPGQLTVSALRKESETGVMVDRQTNLDKYVIGAKRKKDYDEVVDQEGRTLLKLWPNFLSGAEADALLGALADTGGCTRSVIYGTPVPRREKFMGEPGLAYTYSGNRHTSAPFCEEILPLKGRIENFLGAAPFNAVFLNIYDSGSDSIGWHADDEPSLDSAQVIASVSLGHCRRVQVKRKGLKGRQPFLVNQDLPHGSLVVMEPRMQATCLHRVPKTKKPCTARINLTFRKIKSTTLP